MALPGEMEMFANGVPGEPGEPGEPDFGDCVRVPPPQANCHMIRNPAAIHEKCLGMASSTSGYIGPARITIGPCWENAAEQ